MKETPKEQGDGPWLVIGISMEKERELLSAKCSV